MRALALFGLLLPAAAAAQDLRPPPSIAPAQIAGSTASGRSVLTGTPAQGATALGLGTASSPTLAGLTVSGTATANTVNANGFQLAGTTILGSAGVYRSFQVAGQQILTAGDGTDTTTYNSNTTHRFRSRDATTIFADLGAAGLTLSVPTFFGAQARLALYTVAALPAGTVGAIAYASNGRKVGEAAGAGTGVIAYYSNGAWRRLSDDSAVAQ